MGKNTKVIIGIIIALIIVLGGYSLIKNKNNSGNTAQASTYKIGVTAALTGDAASYGETERNILEIAQKQINDQGGVNGKQIELIFEDSKCNGTDGANAAQKLVNVDKVQVILGDVCSSASLAEIPVAEAGHVAIFSAESSSPLLTGKSQYFSRDYPSDASQGKVLADTAFTDKGYKKVYSIVEQTDYAEGIVKVFDQEFKSLGGTNTTEEFATGTNDLKPLVTKAKAANPDALMLSVQTAASAGKIFKAMQDLSWHPNLVVNDIIVGDPPTVSTYKGILEGAIGAEFSIDPNNQTMTKLLADYKTQYGQEMNYQAYGQTAFDALFIIRDGIKAVGYDGTALASWFRTVNGWQGASGSVTIGSDGDRVGGHKPETVKNGQVVPFTK